MPSTKAGPDPNNPEWKEADFAAAGGPEALPAEMAAAFPKTRRRGRPPSSEKELITLRLDRTVLDKFRATGRGWHTRINDALKRAKVGG